MSRRLAPTRSQPPRLAKRRRLYSPEERDHRDIAFKHVALLRPESQIRLFQLHPGEKNTTIVGKLADYDIEDVPSYQAISYTCGPENPQKQLTINSQVLKVRENCYYALWQTRLHSDAPVLVWIDSICINQNDNKEKACQVGMISSIFKKAASTLTCVGSPDQDDGSCVMHQLASMGSTISPTTDEINEDCALCGDLLDNPVGEPFCIDENDPVHGIHEWMQVLSGPDIERLDAALQRFAQRSYWKRVWIQPEVAMSTKMQILCGDEKASMHTLRWLAALFRAINLWREDPGEGTQYLPDLNNDQGQYQWGGPMWQVLTTYLIRDLGPLGGWMHYLMNGLECQVAHDKIYASIAMLEWDAHFTVPSVDYNKSTVQLAMEVLPHMGGFGVPFPNNVRELLELLEFDPVGNDIDRKDLAMLQTTRDNRDRAVPSVASQGSDGSCSCGSSALAYTAVWICHFLTSYMTNSIDHDPEYGCLNPSPNGGLEILVRRNLDIGQGQSGFLETNRPENCLSITGFDVESGQRSIIGFVTVQARLGDHLIRFPETEPGCNYLVLRRTYDDIYEIVGYAVLGLGISVQPSDSQDEPASAIEHQNSPRTPPVPNGFDFWFDAEDVLTHVYTQGTEETKPISQMFILVNRNFTRTRFSSFATACFDIPRNDTHTYCPECAVGYRRRICIHCGGSLGLPESAYFRQDPVERLRFMTGGSENSELASPDGWPRRASV